MTNRTYFKHTRISFFFFFFFNTQGFQCHKNLLVWQDTNTEQKQLEKCFYNVLYMYDQNTCIKNTCVSKTTRKWEVPKSDLRFFGLVFQRTGDNGRKAWCQRKWQRRYGGEMGGKDTGGVEDKIEEAGHVEHSFWMHWVLLTFMVEIQCQLNLPENSITDTPRDTFL